MRFVEIRRGISTGKFVKLVDHMRLVVIAVRKCRVQQAERLGSLNASHHVAESLDPGKHLRRDPDMLIEHPLDPTFAYSRSIDQFRYGHFPASRRDHFRQTGGDRCIAIY